MFAWMAAALVAGTSCGFEGEFFARGIATDLSNGQVVYCEYHLPAEPGQAGTLSQRQVLYYSPEGNIIAKKTIRRVASPRPDVLQLDLRHGEQRQVQRGDRGWQLQYQSRQGENVRGVVLARDEVDVVDAGFDEFVRQHWDGLLRGDRVAFDFASPVHGRKVGLRARSIPCDEGGSSRVCIDVDVAQPLLRLFAGSLHLQYDDESRRLLVFEGVSNVLDARGNSQKVRIRYDYPRQQEY
ncbi:hypothetical protein [Microbulbifer aggregans]|uniref:hypothetical protein n=1 Tax=Microbulbifer aggregans TaxID=1769779 RepID=UPI001CFD7EE4|nr:hypothetical protein [Microbulbifer aggregans]